MGIEPTTFSLGSAQVSYAIKRLDAKLAIFQPKAFNRLQTVRKTRGTFRWGLQAALLPSWASAGRAPLSPPRPGKPSHERRSDRRAGPSQLGQAFA